MEPTPAEPLRSSLSAALAALGKPPRPVDYLPTLRVSGHDPAAYREQYREQWHAVGGLLVELAAVAPDEQTLELGGRWADARPEGAVPSLELMAALTPMLVAHGRMLPAATD